MATFRILYFSEGLLENSDVLQAGNAVEAVRHASSRWPHLKAEVWLKNARVAVVRPSAIGVYHAVRRSEVPAP